VHQDEVAQLTITDSLFINTIDPEPIEVVEEPVEIIEEPIEVVEEPTDIIVEDLILEQEPVEELEEDPVISNIEEIPEEVIIEPAKEEPVVEEQKPVTMIDGESIDEWLFQKKDNDEPANQPEIQSQQPSNNRLQTTTRPIINSRPDDILNTIKRYHNVRLDDAKRTSKR
jgi:hypothetical protein